MKEIRDFLPRLTSNFIKVFFVLFFTGVFFLATAINASAQPDIYVSLTNIEFFPTAVGMNYERILKIYNFGDANLVVLQPMSITDNTDFSLDYNDVINSPCGNAEPTIMPGELCMVKIIFSPSSVGEHTAELSIRSNDPDEQEIIVSLLGEATAPADIEVSPTTINFGSFLVGENSSHREINIQNTGGGSLYPLTNLSDWTNFGLDEYGGSNPCGLGAAITNGSECTMTAWFKPASAGIFSERLTITSNDPDESKVIVTLNGNGCSSFLITESQWYEIQGIPEDAQTVIIRATFTNKDSFGRDLSFSEETFQLWGYPIDPDADVLDIPNSLINIVEVPTGTIIQDATFTYYFKVNLSSLPYIPKLGFRVVTVEGGTMKPSDVPLNDSCVIIITKTKAMPWIPLLLLDE